MRRNHQQSLCPTRSLFTLPGDILPLIFSYLCPYELCCLDCAVLNHANRPFFLSALIHSFQLENQESIFELEGNDDSSDDDGDDENNDGLEIARWSLSRRIPIKHLVITRTSCPKELILMSTSYLQTIKFNDTKLGTDDCIVLSQCSDLKSLCLNRCTFAADFKSIFQNLKFLETLELAEVPFSQSTVETISRCCTSLKSLLFSFVDVGDDKLLCLVKGCPALCSLHLCGLNITDQSVRMLLNHHPRIPFIILKDCKELSWGSHLSLLREITIPTIFNETEPISKVAAIQVLSSLVTDTLLSNHHLLDLLNTDSLLERLVHLLSHQQDPLLRISLIHFLCDLVLKRNFHHIVANAGALSAVVHTCSSLQKECITTPPLPSPLVSSFKLFEAFTFTHFSLHLVSAGILSLFRSYVSDSIPFHSLSPNL
jgi:hypothetical protein